MDTLILDGEALSLAEIESVALAARPVAIAVGASARVRQSREFIEEILVDHEIRGPVLDRAGRVAVLELGPQPHIGGWREPGQPHERGPAERIEQRVVAHRAPVARLGAGLPRRAPRPVRPAGGSAASAGHRGQDGHGVAVRDRGLQAAEEPHVLVVQVHVDETPQPGVVDQPVPQALMPRFQVTKKVVERRAGAFDRLGACGVVTQDGRDTDLDGHGQRSRV